VRCPFGRERVRLTLVSITRARVRSIWTFPSFALAASAALRQAQRADGFLAGALLPDRRRTFWTMTAWTSEKAMRGYMMAGAHHRSMSKFAVWCDEASVVHWDQDEEELPHWDVAVARMKSEGRPSRVRQPSADHQAMSFPTPRGGGGALVAPVRKRPTL
jgi:hypothetical protein